MDGMGWEVGGGKDFSFWRAMVFSILVDMVFGGVGVVVVVVVMMMVMGVMTNEVPSLGGWDFWLLLCNL